MNANQVKAAAEEIAAEYRELLITPSHLMNSKVPETVIQEITAIISRQLEGEQGASAEVEACWTAIHRSFEIEPRSYFETEAPKNGFGSPLAMAMHYIWKRKAKDSEAEQDGFAAGVAACVEKVKELRGDYKDELREDPDDRYRTMINAANDIIRGLESLTDSPGGEQGDFCYADGDEGSRYCGDPESSHCAVLGDADFWKSAEGQRHLVKCMRDDHLIHHPFIASRPECDSAPGGVAL